MNCKHCGYDSCKEFIKEVIRGNKQLENCDILMSENSEVILKINNKLIHCNPFVQQILKNVINGLITSLKTDEQKIVTSEIKIYNKIGE